MDEIKCLGTGAVAELRQSARQTYLPGAIRGGHASIVNEGEPGFGRPGPSTRRIERVKSSQVATMLALIGVSLILKVSRTTANTPVCLIEGKDLS
jgi:hypothetical protein